MSAPLRSKQGCWTCRLRKKKCDEGTPQCSNCTSLSITCYGYGSKPDWMDNGDKERAVANGIKQIVKHTSRRKITTRPLQKPTSVATLAPKSSDLGLNNNEELTPPSDQTFSLEEEGNVTTHRDSIKTQSDEQELSLFGSVTSINPSDSILLMHFLDSVFPQQYPMYKPDILDGGRGWLLTILLRTKPLYHACLALSSYHRRMMIFTKLAHPCQISAKVQQETHLEICLTEFRETMKSVNKYVLLNQIHDELSTVTSIVQLIFFELFAGTTNAWKIHLLAATNVYHQGCGSKLTAHHLRESSHPNAILDPDVPFTIGRAAASQELVTFRFEGGTIIWLDIIASVTSGTAPSLLPYHRYNIADESRTRLELIMGCRNWVMQLLGRVSALQSYKTEKGKDFDSTSFNKEVQDIKIELQHGLAQESLEDISIDLHQNQTAPSDQDITLITYLFALSTQIYLHLITQNFTQLLTLQSAISAVTIMVQTQKIGTHLLPAVVMPLFMVACVAGKGCEQELFVKIFRGEWITEGGIKHRTRLLPVLEEVWRGREVKAGMGWEDVLDIVGDLLLI